MVLRNLECNKDACSTGESISIESQKKIEENMPVPLWNLHNLECNNEACSTREKNGNKY